MKTIGLLGGMTYHTTLTYYEKINQKVHEKLGKNHSAKCLIYSFDFEEIKKLQDQKKWELISKEMIYHGQVMQDSGADYLALCSNTIHKVAKPMSGHLRIPLIHIIEAVGEALVKKEGSKSITSWHKIHRFGYFLSRRSKKIWCRSCGTQFILC